MIIYTNTHKTPVLVIEMFFSRHVRTVTGALAAANSFFGPGSGPIHLDNVECSGDEMEISRCIHAGTGIHNCQHTEDASVICQRKLFP